MDDDENYDDSYSPEAMHSAPLPPTSPQYPYSLPKQKSFQPNVSGEERNQRERLLNTQGEFLNPIVAQRMRAKNNPYRQTGFPQKWGQCLEGSGPMTDVSGFHNHGDHKSLLDTY